MHTINRMVGSTTFQKRWLSDSRCKTCFCKVLYLLTKSLLYSLSFDESLHEVLNKEQMDMEIRIFNDLEVSNSLS